jgi:nucleoside-diphosphate-sugar epimerase
MRVLVIGGTGHIGTHLVPRLVEAGHEVIVMSRGSREPYQPHPAWAHVDRITVDKTEMEKTGTFGALVKEQKADIVMDMLCFTVESAEQLVDSLRGSIEMLLHCGTIWVHGPSVRVPTTEETPRGPLEPYGINKALIEKYLLFEARHNDFPVTILHPGQIAGQGWSPVNPAGNSDISLFSDLAQGKEIVLPNSGMETLNFVHADDVAHAFMQAMTHWNAARAENFHIVADDAITLRGYAEFAARQFGQTPNMRFLPLDDLCASLPEVLASGTRSHLLHSPHCSCDKARRLIDYRPRYNVYETLADALSWMRENEGMKLADYKE